jgi:hypothetical protein
MNILNESALKSSVKIFLGNIFESFIEMTNLYSILWKHVLISKFEMYSE